MPAPVAENARRQEENGPQQGEHGLDADADEAERERCEPDHRPQHEREQGERPAQHEKETPADQCKHCSLTPSRFHPSVFANAA